MIKESSSRLALSAFCGIATLASLGLVSQVYADTTQEVDVTINVPAICSFATEDHVYDKNIIPGHYDVIGESKMKAYCNDNNGFAIYAVGFGGDNYGDNKLSATVDNELHTINTGTATSGDVSAWHMKILNDTTVANNNIATIENNFGDNHDIPTTYTKVASRSEATDRIADTNLIATYSAFIAGNQYPAVYQGEVKYTLVHPSTNITPASRPAMLDTGQNVNAKMKTLAANTTKVYTNTDSLIKAVDVHTDTATPAGFTASDDNTISVAESEYPVYIVFDNTNDVGIMNIYTEGVKIILNQDSSSMFYDMRALADLSDIANWDTSSVEKMNEMFSQTGYNVGSFFSLDVSSWDTSNVTDMNNMFNYAGSNATTWSIGDLSSWDTSKVTDMNRMFNYAGYNDTTWSIGDFSSWDTSKVTNMRYMFNYAGYKATTWSIGDLSSWDTSKVTDMNRMFNCAGSYATTWSIGDLSSWDTSKVTDMNAMFANTGSHDTTWSIGDLSSWDTSKVTNMSYMFNVAGYKATTWSIGDLSSWDTSKVTDMSFMFQRAGYSDATWSIGYLSSWDTSSVTNMRGMFQDAGDSATTFSLDLSGWNTSKVTNMNDMFKDAGSSATTFSLDLSGWNTSSVTTMFTVFYQAGSSATTFSLDLSGWNTSSVTQMPLMFTRAGSNASDWSITIPRTNGNSTNNTTSRMYGKTTSTYASPDSGKSFTLAQ